LNGVPDQPGPFPDTPGRTDARGGTGILSIEPFFAAISNGNDVVTGKPNAMINDPSHPEGVGMSTKSVAGKGQVQVRGRVDVQSWGFSSERLWANPTARKLEFVLDSIPAFTDGLALGDTVRIQNDPEMFIESVVRRSGHSTFRLVFEAGLPTGGTLDMFFSPLAALGCRYEGAPSKGVMGLDCPPQAGAERVFQLLSEGETVHGYVFEDAYFHTP
jgi:hypothetical protein